MTQHGPMDCTKVPAASSRRRCRRGRLQSDRRWARRARWMCCRRSGPVKSVMGWSALGEGHGRICVPPPQRVEVRLAGERERLPGCRVVGHEGESGARSDGEFGAIGAGQLTGEVLSTRVRELLTAGEVDADQRLPLVVSATTQTGQAWWQGSMNTSGARSAHRRAAR
jgi:hypothetical protein